MDDVHDRVARRDQRDVAAELLERRDRVARPLGGPALPLEHEAPHRLVDRREVAVEELLGLVRLAGDEAALAELQRRLLRGRPVAARRRRRASARARRPGGGRRRALPGPRRGASRCRRRGAPRAPPRRTCSSTVWHQLSSTAGVATTTSSHACAIGLSSFAVTTQRWPSNSCTASSVSAVVPSCESATMTSASGWWTTASSACTARPPVWAAWNEVPQPVSTVGSRGSRRSRGTCASHSGCAYTALRVCSIDASIPCRRWPPSSARPSRTASAS